MNKLIALMLIVVLTQLTDEAYRSCSGAERVAKMTRSTHMAQSGGTRAWSYKLSHEFLKTGTVHHSRQEPYYESVEEFDNEMIFKVYTTREIDRKVQSLDRAVDEAIANSNTAIRNAQRSAVAAGEEAASAAEDRSKAFATQEVSRILNAFSNASPSEVSSAFGALVDERVAAARSNDAETIRNLERLVQELSERVTRLEQGGSQ